MEDIRAGIKIQTIHITRIQLIRGIGANQKINSESLKKYVMTTVNKFKAGDIVYDRIRPGQKLIVERISDRLYYCKVANAPHRKAIAYLERELKSEPELATPSQSQINITETVRESSSGF